MATPHNSAQKGEIAKTVLMPGDPLRAKFIAENYLSDAKCVSEVRGMYCFTGTYQGKEVSVMGHGMGMPSIGIYTYELFHFYDVENIIRVGSAGGMQENINVMDLVFAMAASNDSRYGCQYNLPGPISPTASFSLLEIAVGEARKMNAPFHVGNVLSTDVFYRQGNAMDLYRDMGVLACEMEAAALYLNAAEAKKNALAILTVSDHFYKEQNLNAEERQTGFRTMMEVALNTTLQL